MVVVVFLSVIDLFWSATDTPRCCTHYSDFFFFLLFPFAVKCLHCMKTSNTYDPLLDISLDIKGCTSLTKALQKSIKADMLDGDNKYACPL